jgi:sulfur-oxidizing protein SoxA
MRAAFLAGAVVALVGASALAAEAPLALDGEASARPWKRYGDWPKQDFGAWNTLRSDASPPPPKQEPRKLAGPIEGDPAKGMKFAFDRARGGSCVACHVMGAKTPEVPGNVGPDLSEIGNAGRDDEYLFNYVWDARVYNPQTMMPPWGAHGFYDEEEIKHIVAFLKSLKQPATFKAALDDPGQRPVPKEDRDNLDALTNPAMWAVENADAVFKRAEASGKSCATCHGDRTGRFGAWAATMPRYEKRLDRVLGVEEFVFRHAKATTGATMLMQSEDNTTLSTWLRHLANGKKIAVDVDSPGAKEAAERGKALMHRKVGQFNFACFDCHGADKGADHWIRGQWLGESRGQVDHFPTWRTSRNEIWDIRKRFEWCNVAVRGNELPPDAKEYGDIELYLTSLSNGLTLSVPGIRH